MTHLVSRLLPVVIALGVIGLFSAWYHGKNTGRFADHYDEIVVSHRNGAQDVFRNADFWRDSRSWIVIRDAQGREEHIGPHGAEAISFKRVSEKTAIPVLSTLRGGVDF